MVIAAHFEDAAETAGAARAPRRRLLLETEGSLPSGTAASVLVHNVSASGLLIECAEALAEGDRITIALPHAGDTVAEVVWASGSLHGCRFETPVSDAALSAAQLRGQTPASRAPGNETLRDESFSARLHRLRMARGYSLERIAGALGVSKPTVWAWEQGKARPVENRIAPLAALFGIDPAELVTGRESDRLRDLLARTRAEIADAYGTSADNVRILIEL